MTADFHIEEKPLSVLKYQSLRKTTGWDMLDDAVVKNALEKDLYSVAVIDGDRYIGMARVVGDGGMYFYIQDVIVHPDLQGKGIGTLLMAYVERYIESHAPHNAFVALMAAKGVAEFYKKYGYAERPENKPGMYKIMKK